MLEGLACRKRVAPASSPAASASRVRRSRRLCSTLAAAPGFLAHTLVIKQLTLTIYSDTTSYFDHYTPQAVKTAHLYAVVAECFLKHAHSPSIAVFSAIKVLQSFVLVAEVKKCSGCIVPAMLPNSSHENTNMNALE